MNPSDVKPLRSGKVRDVYEAGADLIIVASDRISAFDCILPTPIPDKGKVLSSLSAFWFGRMTSIIPHHLLSLEVSDFPAPYNGLASDWQGRAMLVRRTQVLPVECVVRGYLAGSGWKEYQKTQSICGVALPAGLRESEQLPEPIFTPTTKAEVGSGHDEPITWEQTVEILGNEQASRVRDASLQLYRSAAAYARERGIIIADTKFEFGLVGDEIILIDEIFTPDSSRFWDVATYEAGRPQDSFDKQFVRDYLETLDWDKTPPAPELPAEITQQTAQKYFAAYERITGQKWSTSTG
jgi:phosphoribosylaminoimidazole-succinocarboxamide synthase